MESGRRFWGAFSIIFHVERNGEFEKAAVARAGVSRTGDERYEIFQ